MRVDSPDLDPNCLTLIIFRNECFEKLIEKSADDKKDEKLLRKYVSDCLM